MQAIPQVIASVSKVLEIALLDTPRPVQREWDRSTGRKPYLLRSQRLEIAVGVGQCGGTSGDALGLGRRHE